MQEKDNKNIVLTGFMGTGKTTVGKMLASRLNRKFIDTDDLIQERSGMTIPEIFARHGEAAFRKMESDVAAELGKKQGLVISTGGRLMLDPVNVESLSRDGRVFCLIATPKEILSRIASDDEHERPLLSVPNPGERVLELLKERQKGYHRFLKIITEGKRPDEVAGDLLDIFHDEPKRFSIDHPGHSCEYVLGSGILPFVRRLSGITGRIVVITDEATKEYYGQSCFDVDHIIAFPVGSRHKNLATVQNIYEELTGIGFGCSDTIVALGGSIVGDVAGFVAGTYMRGVNFILCPTSLLAMADTSIGGKTSLDLPQGKNLIGVYKHPSMVIADVATLQTLPAEAFRAGMAEVVKHGLIADRDLLNRVENGNWRHESETLFTPLLEVQALVAQAIQVKIAIVQEDSFESGRRLWLDLGHTFARAIELVSEQKSKYAISHGEAVAIGLVAAANLSVRLGHCDAAMQVRIETLLDKIGLPTRLPKVVDIGALVEVMESEEKDLGANIRLVLPGSPGGVFVADNVGRESLLATLESVAG